MSHIHYNSGTMVSGGSGSRFSNNGDVSFADKRASGNSINVVFEVKYNCFTGQTLGVKLDPSKFTLPEIKVPAGYKVQVIGLNDPFGTNGDESVKVYDSDSRVIQQGISNIIDYLNEFYYDQLGRGSADGELGLAVDSDGDLTSSDSILLSEFADSAYRDYISAGTDIYYRVLGNKFSGNGGNYSSASEYWKYMQIMLSPLLTSVYQKNFQYHQGDNMYELSDTFFTLVPEDQHVTVQYKDGDKIVNSQVFNGKTDQTITLTFDKVPANYDVDGTLPSSSYKFTADGNQIIVINLKHQTETVPENKTIKRTIKVTTPNGKTTDKSQKLDFKRTATIDKVTGKATNYSDWIPVNDGSFAEVDVPDIPGYTPSQKRVDAHTLTQDDINNWTDPNVNIVYTANKQHVTVQYKDGDKVVASQVFNGHTDETTNLTFDKVPANYDVDGDLPDSNYKFTADGNQTVIVNLKHQTENVPDAKTVTRTINVTTPDGKTKTVAVQKVNLSRTNVRDKVTGDVTDGTWNNGHFDEFTDIPVIPGYTPSQTSVAAQDVDGTTQNGTINITYTANKQTGKISYVDQKTNEEIKSEPLNGVTDGNVAVKVDVPAGYHVVSGQNIPTSVKATADGIPTVTVYVAKDETPSKPVTPEKPVTPAKPSQPAEKPTTPTQPQKPSTPAQKPAKKTSNKQNAGNSQADANRLKMLEKERKARLAALAAKAAEQADAEARAKARARAARAEAARKAMEAAQAKRNAAAVQAASESRSNSLNTAQGAKAQAASETETAAQAANASAQNANAKSQKSDKLPQTGDQNNGEGAVVLGALAGILGLFGLGADRKRRRD